MRCQKASLVPMAFSKALSPHFWEEPVEHLAALQEVN